METKFKFTKTALDAVKCPADKAVLRVTDTLTPGLTLRITQNGSRVYYLYRKVDGRPLECRIESADKITLDEARRLAVELNGKIALQQDPRQQKRSAREAATLADLWETYRNAVTKGARTMIEDEGVYKRYLSPWGSRRLTDITDEAVQKLHNRIAGGNMDRESKDSLGRVRKVKGGPTAARLAMALLSGMFSSKSAKKLGVVDNPASGIETAKPNAKERYLSPEEMPAFWTALAGQSEGMRDLFKMALFTGQRRMTLLSMRWDEVNLNFATWTIPADKMKGGKTHVVPLVRQALAILQRRKAADKGAQWVFPGPGETGHIQEVKKAIAAVVKAAGINDISLHDLRRTCATWMNSGGASLSTIQDVLAQTPQTVAGIHYIKSNMDSAKLALQAAVDAMEGAAEKVAVGKVA